MGNYFGNKKCTICKGKSILYRAIKDKHYYLCDSNKCNFLSLLRAGVLIKRDFKNN